MTERFSSPWIYLCLAVIFCVAGCNNDESIQQGPGATGGLTSSANDFGGSGVVMNSGIAGPFVLFQNDSVSRMTNRDGGAVKPTGVNNIYSLGAYVDPNDANRIKFFVNDRVNNRVLIFNIIPQNGTAVPDVVVGQADFVSSAANAGGVPSTAGFSENVHMSVCSNGNMFVADRQNNRVMAYNRVPTSNGATADFVIGQPDFVSVGQVNPPSASSLFHPYAAYCMANKLFVVDKDNNRILVYDPIPSTTNPVASYVIGQPGFVTNAAGCTPAGLNSPYEILRVGDTFYIADGGNHRVLKFDTIPGATGVSATAVLGQGDLTSCLANRGVGAPTEKTLNFPNALAANGSRVAVSDHTNNRVMLFDLPITTDQSASSQIGQPGFITATTVDPPTATSIRSTKGLIFDQGHLWIGDGQNHRVVVIATP